MKKKVYFIYDSSKSLFTPIFKCETINESIKKVREIIEDKLLKIGIPTPSTCDRFNDLKRDLQYCDTKLYIATQEEMFETVSCGEVFINIKDELK